MSFKDLRYKEQSREALERGINKVADAVKVTLGPKGRVVVMGRQFGGPAITKDGVTVAKDIKLEDPFENLGAQLIQEVASKTNDETGDGTTTSTVIAQSIINEGIKYLASGGHAVNLKKGIDLAVEKVLDYVQSTHKPVENKDDIIFVATIAGNNGEVGEIIAKAVDGVGKNGIVTLEESKTWKTEIEFSDGMSLDKGMVSKVYATDEAQKKCELVDPLILIIEKKITSIYDVIPVISFFAKNRSSFIIIAEDFSEDFTKNIWYNMKVSKQLKDGCLVKAPGLGSQKSDLLQDIAIFTGTQVFENPSDIPVVKKFDETGQEYFDLDDTSIFGKVNKATITRDETKLIQGSGSKESITNRMAQLEDEKASATSDYEIKKIDERLSRLSGGAAIIRIGAITETELKEKKDRFEDALAATRASIESGTVTGGGVTLARASQALASFSHDNDDVNCGIKIVRKALLAPLWTIADNAGAKGDVVVSTTLANSGDYGYNADTEVWEDLRVAGIIDPTNVTLNAVKNAASIAGMVLLTECVINDIPKDEQPNMMGMPGM